MDKNYRLMIYFAVGTLHFYRKDILPLGEKETTSVFMEKNKNVIKRVMEESINLFNYELSQNQLNKAVNAYCTESLSVENTEAVKLN